MDAPPGSMAQAIEFGSKTNDAFVLRQHDSMNGIMQRMTGRMDGMELPGEYSGEGEKARGS